jgi:hypothetical protein
VFATRVKQEDGEITLSKLFEAGLVHIKRHTKIKAVATPYDPAHFEYLSKRTGDEIRFTTAA